MRLRSILSICSSLSVLQPRFRLGDAGGAVAGLGVPALQDEQVVGGEIDRVEAQRIAGRRQPVRQVGAGPVDHRHEIVADRRDARPWPARGSCPCTKPT